LNGINSDEDINSGFHKIVEKRDYAAGADVAKQRAVFVRAGSVTLEPRTDHFR